jgi:hypothetical protein
MTAWLLDLDTVEVTELLKLLSLVVSVKRFVKGVFAIESGHGEVDSIMTSNVILAAFPSALVAVGRMICTQPPSICTLAGWPASSVDGSDEPRHLNPRPLP